MVQDANEKLRKRNETIDKLTSQLNSTMSELSEAQAALARMQKEKADLSKNLQQAKQLAEQKSPVRLVASSESDEDDFWGSQRHTERLVPQAWTATKPQSGTELRPHSSEDKDGDRDEEEDGDGDRDELRDLWGAVPDVVVPRRGSSASGSSISNDLAMVKRRMRAKKQLALSRAQNQSSRE